MKKKSTKRKLKGKLAFRLGVGAGCLVLLAGAGFYGWKAYYYKDKFFKNTVINQVDCSELSIEEAEALIRKQVEDYLLQIQFRDDVTEEIAGQEIDYRYVSDNGIAEVMKSQNPLGWMKGLFAKHSYEVNENISFDEKKLDQKIKELNSLKSAVKSPENAYVVFEKDEFVIVDEVYGNKIKKDLLAEAITDAVKASEELVSVEEAGAYVMPELTKDSEEIIREKEQLNRLAKASITYELPKGEKVLDGNELKSWLEVDSSGNYVKDEEKFRKKIKKYVEDLAEEVNTRGKARPFHTTSGRDVMVTGGTYGWKIDQEKEREELEKNLSELEVVSRKPKYSSEELYKENHGLGDTYIEINLTEQHLYYYKDGEVVLDSPLVSGTMVEDRFTPPGVYFLSWKQKDRVLRGKKLPDGTYSYESPVAFWMPFNGGIGLHDASWRGSFGGTIYKYGGSHGCINLPYAKAEKIYEMIDKKTPIVCVYNDGYSLHENPPEEQPTE